MASSSAIIPALSISLSTSSAVRFSKLNGILDSMSLPRPFLDSLALSLRLGRCTGSVDRWRILPSVSSEHVACQGRVPPLPRPGGTQRRSRRGIRPGAGAPFLRGPCFSGGIRIANRTPRRGGPPTYARIKAGLQTSVILPFQGLVADMLPPGGRFYNRRYRSGPGSRYPPGFSHH